MLECESVTRTVLYGKGWCWTQSTDKIPDLQHPLSFAFPDTSYFVLAKGGRFPGSKLIFQRPNRIDIGKLDFYAKHDIVHGSSSVRENGRLQSL